jgi:hypothetical protein
MSITERVPSRRWDTATDLMVVGDHAAGVAEDVRVAFVQRERFEDVEARVHAGHDHEPALRLDR